MARLRSAMKWGVGPVRSAWTSLNDWALNIDTRLPHAPLSAPANPAKPWWRGEFSKNARHDDNYGYASPDYAHIRKTVRIVNPSLADVLYDLGSGTGRILCMFARRRMRRCVGIELFEDLCAIARSNAQQLRGRKSPIDIMCEDAAKADLSDGTIYFMFNPFGPDTMRDVLGNIRSSLTKNPRNITIVYHNATLERLLEDEGWLERYHYFDTLGGLRVSFWRGRV